MKTGSLITVFVTARH